MTAAPPPGRPKAAQPQPGAGEAREHPSPPSPGRGRGEGGLRVVLDTNVLLSLFVFADSRLAPLRERLEAGQWRALTSASCLEEFRRVLAYPEFGLGEAAQREAFAAYERLVERVTALPPSRASLPLCKDPDDQKFLELARDGGAHWLVTSDKALLKLARRGRLAALFRILTPEAALTPSPAPCLNGPGR